MVILASCRPRIMVRDKKASLSHLQVCSLSYSTFFGFARGPVSASNETTSGQLLGLRHGPSSHAH